MREVPIHEAKGKLSGLIRAAGQGEKVVLTKHGKPVAEITPIKKAPTREEKLAAIRKAQKAFRGAFGGEDPSRVTDYLYNDETGLPE